MKIINLGSLNIDHVYRVDQFVSPGETIPSLEYNQFCGGKGLNQSIALARAGATVFHYGKIGKDGTFLVEILNDSGVNTRSVCKVDGPTGHAIIQVSSQGENSIIIEGGANRSINATDIETVFTDLSDRDWLLLQNEVNGIEEIFAAAQNSSCKVAFNPAPMTDNIKKLPLHRVDLLIVNETEGQALTGQTDTEGVLAELKQTCPDTRIVLTLGVRGAIYIEGNKRLEQPGFVVNTVDTTAAGDTFVGYFLAALSNGKSAEAALNLGCRAASICVTKQGTADSIPYFNEIKG